jgi:hypothetical protein
MEKYIIFSNSWDKNVLTALTVKQTELSLGTIAFPFHTPPFTSRVAMMDPYFVASDDSENTPRLLPWRKKKCLCNIVSCLGLVLHRLYETQVCCRLFRRNNHD